MKWADKYRTLGVRTNADTPPTPARPRVRRRGHRPDPHRAHVLRGRPHHRDARDDPGRHRRGREKALNKLLPFQRDDFIGIFKAMNGLPVTIRLLDPPLHEFLPHTRRPEGTRQGHGVSVAKVREARDQLHEEEPMLGHRGCRLCVTYPEILEMQVRRRSSRRRSTACAATSRPARDHDPAGGHARELAMLRASQVEATIAKVKPSEDSSLDIKIGTMIEIPRAALTATRSPSTPTSSASAPTT
jgi:pyruvate,orthophosphate dikinase